jgi:predicted tellurium resistance membrane protein TerC
MLAAIGRIVLLFAISWVITLDKSVLFTLPFEMPGHPVGDVPDGETPITWKDLILLLGGVFLIGKATWEIGHQLEHHPEKTTRAYSSFGAVLLQILAIDLVFSLDSVLTAVGMVPREEYTNGWVPLAIMISAVLLAIAVMIAFSGPIARFVNNHPSVKMLALAFLILIGVVLVAEAFHTHIPRGYIYCSMGFSLFVETLNLRAARARPA